MVITIAADCLEQLLAEAANAHPRECCGILLGEGDYIAAIRPAANVHSDPERYFEIDPQALLDAHREARRGGFEIVGYYHSHPNGRAEPSGKDRRQSPGDGRVWAIAVCRTVSFWRDGDDGFTPLSYSVAEE